MKKSMLLTIMMAGGLATTLAWASPGPGLLGTPHDFTNTGGVFPYDGNNGATPGSGLDADGQPLTDVGLCTYCHTPHKALSSHLLWNHTLSANTYSWDVSSTTAGTTLPTIDDQTYNGATAKCLSCHDGTVAIGDVAWYYEGGQVVNANKITDPAFVIANGSSMAGNHPVAIAFPFNNQPSTYNNTTTGSSAYLDEWQTDPTTLGIRLFTDDGAGIISAGPTVGKTGIECSSCHDPHNKQAVADYFLRGQLDGSDTNYICLKCHSK